MNGQFLFRGKITTAHELGNIIYGYLGSAMCFSDVTLYWGGGVANSKKINTPEVTVAPFYGDLEDDHYFVEDGINLFYSDYPSYYGIGFEGIPIEPGIIAAVADLFLGSKLK